MDIERNLRKLARSSYWQNLHRASKECTGINLFENSCNFSAVQVRFIYWLSVYDMLFDELLKHEDDLLTDNVILDDDRCDAYLVYRNKKHDYLWKEYRKEERVSRKSPKKASKDGKQQSINIDFRREK